MEKITQNEPLLAVTDKHVDTNDNANFGERSLILKDCSKDKHYTKSRCRSQSPVSDKENLIASSQTSKSLDSVEIHIIEADRNRAQDEERIDESNVNFSHSRELWQKRVNLQCGSVDTSPKPNIYTKNWLQKHTPDLVMDLPLEDISSKKLNKKSSQCFYSDASSSEEGVISLLSLDSPTGPESPDMSTAAERFAKQNQCTLKKNTKLHTDVTSNMIFEQQSMTEVVCTTAAAGINSNMVTTSASNKPQIKAKPALLKKPVLSFVAP